MSQTKKAVITAIVLIAALLAFSWWCARVVSPQDLQAFLARSGSLAPLGYILLFTLLPAFFFPVAVLALAGGLLFGLVWGSMYTFLGAMLNCTLMFLLSRYVGRERVKAFLSRKLSPVWQRRLSGSGGRSGFLLLIVLRLIPAVPYNLINYAFGLTDISLAAYLLGSAIGIIPGTLVFINIGDKALDTSSPHFWIALGLLALLLVVTSLLGKRIFPKNQQEMENNHEKD